MLDSLAFVFTWGYVFVFFCLLKSFLPVRGNRWVQLITFLVVGISAGMVIFPNDLHNLLGAMVLFCATLLVFFRGDLLRKLSALLIFCPAFIAVNYLMQALGSHFFFGTTSATSEMVTQSPQLLLHSTVIYTVSTLLRLLFWVLAWGVLRRFLPQITTHLTTKMWLIIDTPMLASFVAIFTIIYYLPEAPVIAYPICIAAIVSSFGCICLAAYLCGWAQTAYRAQALEQQKNYYKERMEDERQVRSVYHDLKNHLLVLQAGAQSSLGLQQSVQALQAQIEGYETYLHTGNEFVDILLRDKWRLAREAGIDFCASVQFESGAFLDLLDISTLFGNALDNAIEASTKLPQPQRMITVKAKRVHNLLSIVFENNALPPAADALRSTKGDPFAHGFGLANLKKSVEKYDGQYNIKHIGGVFSLTIILPIPASA